MSEDRNLPNEILSKVDTLANIIHQYNATNKNYHSKVNTLATKSADLVEQIGSLKAANEKQVSVIKHLESNLNRVSANDSACSKDSSAPNEYLQVLRSAMMNRSLNYPIEGKLVTELRDWAAKSAWTNHPSYDQPAKERITKDMIEGINPQGGYWILPEYSPTEVSRIFETSPMMQLCNVAPTSSDIYRAIINDNLAASGGWVGETEVRVVTDTGRIGELDIPLHEIFAQPQASLRILEDAKFDIVSFIQRKSRQTIELIRNAAFLVGNGSKKPRGILNYPSWTGGPVEFGNEANYTREALEIIKSGEDGEFTYNGLVNIQTSLLEEYQPNATWLTTRQSWAKLLQIKDNQGRPLIQLQNLLQTGASKIVLGNPLRIAAPATAPLRPLQPEGGGMPLPAVGAKALIYGDFREGYTIPERSGYYTITDMITEKQYVKYYVRTRLGGALSSYQSLKVHQLSA